MNGQILVLVTIPTIQQQDPDFLQYNNDLLNLRTLLAVISEIYIMLRL